MPKYAGILGAKNTPQMEGLPGMVENNAGGYAYTIDKWKQLERFLILGSIGGSYYVGERKLTKENAGIVQECLKEDYEKAVDTIVAVSDAGRAPKNDPALFALAVASADARPEARRYALGALPRVARIPTHLFQFVGVAEDLRGWGRGMRRAIGDWYNRQTPDHLAFEIAKYQQREGWSNRDLLRLAHPKGATQVHNDIFRYIVKGEVRETLPAIIKGVELARGNPNPNAVTSFINNYGLTREMIPTECLNDKDVWRALLQRMPLNAIVRNLGKMTTVGLLDSNLRDETKLIFDRLTDEKYIRESRLHPVSIMLASAVYEQGHGMKGKLKWSPVPKIVEALDRAFYLSFANVEPTGKNYLIGLDVSGSMSALIANTPLSARVGAAAMALILSRTEKNVETVAFSSGGWRPAPPTMSTQYVTQYTLKTIFHPLYGYVQQTVPVQVARPSAWGNWDQREGGVVPFPIHASDRVKDVVKKTDNLPFGGTDCALPIIYAMEKGLKVDVFVTITDNETWAGKVHPSEALRQYRQKINPRAKNVVLGMTATEFTVNDPNDPGGLDVAGFDTSVPAVVADFVRG